jgi:hypothetical protein
MDYSLFKPGQVYTRRHHSVKVVGHTLYISQVDHQANSLTLRSFVCNAVEFFGFIEKLELEEYAGFFA